MKITTTKHKQAKSITKINPFTDIITTPSDAMLEEDGSVMNQEDGSPMDEES